MKSLSKRSLLPLVFLLFLCWSCRKYNDPWGCKDCPRGDNECLCESNPEILDTSTGLAIHQRIPQGESPEYDTYVIVSVKVNPANNNQISFYERHITSYSVGYRLVLYDIQSKTKTYASDIFGFELGLIGVEWDEHNNLYLNYNLSNLAGIAKLNIISGEIEYATFPNVEQTWGADWVKKTQSIGFLADIKGNVDHQYFMYNFEKGKLDTFLPDTSFHFDKDVEWSDDLFVNGGYVNKRGKIVITYYDWPNNKQGLVAKTWQFKSGTERELEYLKYKWLPNSSKLYMSAHDLGIFYSNVKGGNLVRIKKYCDNLRYHGIDITGDGSKVIALRRQYRYSNDIPRGAWVNGWLYTKDEIVMMDPDGCNEEVIYKGY